MNTQEEQNMTSENILSSLNQAINYQKSHALENHRVQRDKQIVAEMHDEFRRILEDLYDKVEKQVKSNEPQEPRLSLELGAHETFWLNIKTEHKTVVCCRLGKEGELNPTLECAIRREIARTASIKQ